MGKESDFPRLAANPIDPAMRVMDCNCVMASPCPLFVVLMPCGPCGLRNRPGKCAGVPARSCELHPGSQKHHSFCLIPRIRRRDKSPTACKATCPVGQRASTKSEPQGPSS